MPRKSLDIGSPCGRLFAGQNKKLLVASLFALFAGNRTAIGTCVKSSVELKSISYTSIRYDNGSRTWFIPPCLIW